MKSGSSKRSFKLDSKRKRKHALKGFSVFFAFFLWLYVLSSAQTKGEKIVKLDYRPPGGYAVKNRPVKEVTYSIRGPRVFIRALMQKTDTLKVDLSRNFDPDSMRYEINVSELGVNFPFGVELVRVEPNRLAVQLEKALKKNIPVKVVTSGEVPSDHKLASSSVEPGSVAVSGPGSLVKNVKQIETVPVDLGALTGSGSVSALLASPDERLRLGRREVRYHYVIHPTRANMVLKDIPIKFLSSRLVQSSDRRRVNIMVLADNGEDLEYNKRDIEVVAEVPDGAAGKTEVDLSAVLPPGLHLLEIQPAKVTVELEGKSAD